MNVCKERAAGCHQQQARDRREPRPDLSLVGCRTVSRTWLLFLTPRPARCHSAGTTEDRDSGGREKTSETSTEICMRGMEAGGGPWASGRK